MGESNRVNDELYEMHLLSRRLFAGRSVSRATSLVTVAALLAACSGSGGDGGDGGYGGGGPSPPTGDNPNLQATFASIQDGVFTPICATCHFGASAPVGLRLDAANSYGLLVGVASGEAPSVLRVAPGNPSASYLIQKLEGTAAVGGRMPLNGTPLPQADINVIRQWITDGAQGLPTPPPRNPIRITSLSPLPSSTLTALPVSITAMFDRELDASTVNATTFLVDRSGGDGTFADGNEVTIIAAAVTVPMVNSSSAVFDLTGVPNIEDTYRVRVLGSGPATLQDLSSNALDGEFGGTFPSGDGTAGGVFVAQFVVARAQATLQSIQADVFTPRCAGCHTGPPSNRLPGGMDLSSANASFMSLVAVASVEVPSLQRVRVGDPANSYLIQKLDGTAATGAQMPLGQPPLNQETIVEIGQWINNGARF